MERIGLMGAGGILGRPLMERWKDRSVLALGPGTAHPDRITPHSDLSFLDGLGSMVYLAWSSVPASQDSEEDERRRNLEPLLHVAQGCAHRGVFLLFLSSGGAVYGQPTVHPTPESHALDPVSPYGWGKVEAESQLAGVPELSWAALRPGNIVSSQAQAPKKAQFGLLDHALARIPQGEPLSLYGWDVTRDYLVDVDFFRAVELALEHREALSGRAWNVGSGVEVSNGDLVTMVEERVGRKAVLDEHPSRPFDVRRSFLDDSAFRKVTGFSPSMDLQRVIGLRT